MNPSAPLDDHTDDDEPPTKRRWSALLVGFIWGVLGVVWFVALQQAFDWYVGGHLKGAQLRAALDNWIVDQIRSVLPSHHGRPTGITRNLGMPVIIAVHAGLMGIAAAAFHRSWRVGISAWMWTISPMVIFMLLLGLLSLVG